jgi:serine/threonine-protein kinase
LNPLESGRTVGRYRILDFLGAGAMGEVYLAEDPQIERRLAIKTVRLVGRPADVEDRKKRLLREARAAGRLLHPNVVTLFDAGEDQGMLFLAFEFVEGNDLAARLEKGPSLSLREVLRIVRQTAEALDFAHSHGIVHRDIKPSNILLDSHGRVKVADFGIAKMAGQNTEMTVAGSVMGSPQYLSPEQIRGDELDGRSDIFSLGVLLYELLSRKRPFEGDTITTLVYQILHKEPPPISELRRIPDRLELLLRRMIAKDRKERFTTAGEVAVEIAEIERELADETLSAPAADLPVLEATRMLPRSTGAPVSPPRSVLPPPLPLPATTRPVPPPPGAPAGTMPTEPTQPPLPPPPAVTTSRTPVARAGGGPAMVFGLAAVGLLLVAAILTGVWYMFFRGDGTQGIQGEQPTVAQTDVPGDLPGDLQVQTPATGPAANPGARATPAPQGAPLQEETETSISATPEKPAAVEPVPAAQRPFQMEPQARPKPPKADETPRTQPFQAAPPPPRPRERAPVVVPAPEPAPAHRDEPEVTPVPVEERRSAPAASDAVVRTGLELAFRTTPPDAFVLIDGRVVGRASEWSGLKGNRTYTLPGPGEYEIKVRSQGLRDYRIQVEASESGGVTPIFARLLAVAGASADASDLRMVRVSEAVGFRVNPPAARILVNGQPAGIAKELGGRIGQPRSWLRLPNGRHRVSIVAPGHQQQDIVVEVTPGAEKERDRIEVDLSPGGDE